MKAFSSIQDSFYSKKEQYNFIERFYISLIRDERDLPFVKLTVTILLTMIPLGIFLYVPGVPTWLWWTVATVYFFLNNLYFKGPFGLMLHCTCHIKLYKFKYDKLNLVLPWFVGLFFGQTPETYFSHHIGMHHIENNLEEDESSTMAYQRDSFRDFLKYFGSFMYRGLLDVSMYFSRKNREKLMVKIIRGEVLYFIMCVGLCFLNWPATLVVFILPLIISRFIMMLGNWTQHSFIDAADPGNHYKNSITCINTKYNKKCWNDGYHISHHVKPTMHWTEHPNHFLDNLPKYNTNNSIVFDGIGFLEVFIYLMRKRYDKLEYHFVNINNQYASGDEVIALMKLRTKKIEVSGQ
ncbi:fatty acid desaturase [uncultured Cytophaga sp.]|uniref:fatty acid desaturase family protein n=1 Tax=uncultured Cytophaga sp. TaxID=160238 RepID=UPI0026234475|nr:fatty acid desaturase [uncultured Cytophaga sp.]